MNAFLHLGIGTSGQIWPAANLPYLADRLVTSIVQINPVMTKVKAVAAYYVEGLVKYSQDYMLQPLTKHDLDDGIPGPWPSHTKTQV